jgi:UDP-N-acetyl-D-glucosamine dehydrogenase
MPHHVVQKVVDALNTECKAVRGARILVLGVSYKRDIDDLRESPAMDVMADLALKGAGVAYHDPYVPVVSARDWSGDRDLVSTPLNPESLAAADCVVVVTDHRVFDYELIVQHAALVVDCRNAIKSLAPHVFKLGAP